MDNFSDDKNLIFLISQPRSGSTLLQHILGNHSRIRTAPEPWIMLLLTQGLRDTTDLEADFNFKYAKKALEDFLGQLPDGKEAYRRAIRHAAFELYNQTLHGQDEDIFLDKTPRYYHIIEEIKYLFPKSKLILLTRNPISVFASVLDTNMNGNWRALFKRKDRYHDIFTGPNKMAKAINKFGDESAVTNYERLVQHPAEEVGRICKEIGINYESDMTEYGKGPSFSDTTFVDPKSIYSHEKAVTDYIHSWKETLDTPQKIFLGRKYIEHLGPKLIDDLGYNYDSILSDIKDINQKKRDPNIPWDILITPESDLPLFKRIQKRFLVSLEDKGILRGLWSFFRDHGSFLS